MFIKEFLMNTKQIGAILPSSIFLAPLKLIITILM